MLVYNLFPYSLYVNRGVTISDSSPLTSHFHFVSHWLVCLTSLSRIKAYVVFFLILITHVYDTESSFVTSHPEWLW